MITGDNDTCDKFFAGTNDTGEQLSPVTTTPAITFFTGVVDTGQKYSKCLKLIAGVNDTSEKLFCGVNDNDTVQELSYSIYRHSQCLLFFSLLRAPTSPLTASINTLISLCILQASSWPKQSLWTLHAF
jgi:hypothetical protein